MRKRLAALLAALVAWGIAPAAAQSTDYNLFKAYAALKVPRSKVPVGARWIPGAGPTGPGEPAENLIEEESFDSGIINETLKRDLNFSLAAFFGFSNDRQRTFKAEFSDLKILRVADLVKVTTAHSGDQLLFEALKAETIKITTDLTSAAAIKAKAEREGLALSGEYTSGNSTHIELKGSNLFLAYQVLSFGSVKVTRKTARHGGKEATLFDTYRFRFCQCDPGTPLTIEIQNIRSITPGGDYETKRIVYDPVGNRLNEYPLKAYFTGSKVAAARASFKYHVIDGCTSTQVRKPDGTWGRLCFPHTFPKDENTVTVIMTEFDIKPVAKPSATY